MEEKSPFLKSLKTPTWIFQCNVTSDELTESSDVKTSPISIFIILAKLLLDIEWWFPKKRDSRFFLLCLSVTGNELP